MSRQAVPKPVAALLAMAPISRGWRKKRRDKFFEAFGAVLDYCVEVQEEDPLPELIVGVREAVSKALAEAAADAADFDRENEQRREASTEEDPRG